MAKKLLLFTLSILFSQIVDAQIIFVNQQVSGGLQDGTSWQNAFSDLRQALGIAQYGDEIWVAAGTYKPTVDTDRTASFNLKNGVRIYGGFGGVETAVNQRNILINKTILSGEIGDSLIRSDNSFHVLYGADLDESTLLDGVTITAGYANGNDNLTDAEGGGLLLESFDFMNTRPVLRNCTFEMNYSSYNGGAVALEWVSGYTVNPFFDQCIFTRNRAVYGGAIYKSGPSTEGQTFLIQACTFSKNKSGLDGGAIFFNTPGANTRIANSNFEYDSTGSDGGAIYFSLNSWGGHTGQLNLDSCLFKNIFAGEGGGLIINDATLSADTVTFKLNITNCRFEKSKTRYGAGAALLVSQYLTGNTSFVINMIGCVVKDNVSLDPGSASFICPTNYGASSVYISNSKFINNKNYYGPTNSVYALYVSGSKQTNVWVDNCLFADNGDAIGIYNSKGRKTRSHITNCTFSNNRKVPIGKTWYEEDDGINAYNKCYVSNCILWEPETIIYYMFFNGDFFNSSIYDYHIDYCALSISSLIGVPGQFEALGSHIKWETYPDFVDTAAYDFTLKPCSPVVNKGDNAIVDSLGLFTDLSGAVRTRFGTVDIGAYEAQDSCLEVGVAYLPNMQEMLSLAPNPSDGKLQIDLPESISSAAHLSIFDQTGRKVYETMLHDVSSPIILDLTRLIPGVYAVRLKNNTESYTAKWIKT